MLFGRLGALKAIGRPARNAFKHHDLAGPGRGQRREDEILAGRRRDVESNARWIVGSEAGDVGESERALRLVERRALGIALEQLDDVALAAGDEHKIAAARIVFQICDPGVANDQFAAAVRKLLHPAGIFDALIDRLSGLVEQVNPIERLAAVRPGNADAEAVGVRTLLLPVIEAEVALGLQRVVEHELARHHLAGGDVLRRAVGNEPDPIAVLEQAEAQLHAGLAGADDGDVAHVGSPRESVVWSLPYQFVIPSTLSSLRAKRSNPIFQLRARAALQPARAQLGLQASGHARERAIAGKLRARKVDCFVAVAPRNDDHAPARYSISNGIAGSARSGPMAV